MELRNTILYISFFTKMCVSSFIANSNCLWSLAAMTYLWFNVFGLRSWSPATKVGGWISLNSPLVKQVKFANWLINEFVLTLCLEFLDLWILLVSLCTALIAAHISAYFLFLLDNLCPMCVFKVGFLTSHKTRALDLLLLEVSIFYLTILLKYFSKSMFT